MAKEVAPSVNPSIEVPKSLKMCPIHQIPNDGFSMVSIVLLVVECCSVVATRLRKYVVGANSQDDSVKLTNYGNFSNTVDVIRHKLGDDGVKVFKSICFGHFLDVKSMTFCSAIVHSFLVRVLECNDPDVLEFNFWGIGERFDRNAFNLVTGLKFSQFLSFLETRDLPDTLWNKYFGVRSTLEQKEFMTKFERYLFNETEVEDNVKVCMFYLLEAVLLASDKRKSYPIHNRLHLTAQEKKEAYITSIFKSIAYRSYDGPPSVVENVDNTTVDPLAEQVQSDRHTSTMTASTAHAPYPLENKLDDLNRKVQLIMQHLGIEVDTMELSERSIIVYSGSLRTPPPQQAPMATTSGPVFMMLVKGVTWYERVPKKSTALVSPYTPLQDSDASLHPPLVDSSASTGDQGILTLMYDPYQPVEENRRTLLIDFLDDSSKLSHGVDIMVLDKNNFHMVLTSSAWLHSDESLYYRFEAYAPMMQTKYLHPSERQPIPSHDWTLNVNDDTMTNYVKGISPLLSSSWRDVDCICNAESLRVLFPYVLAAGGFYDERPELTFNGTPILDAFSMSRMDAALCPQ
ncbi:hypothetical protein FNV43_RR05403 [Rhamnella rubrinervis]|uniref:DUF1985 domain-containing protein n=1 Tax=Rhamnella rubrinervis TaxID=2594499 RepID=A0A8K0MRJ9_9ROSA|nr:hypothetical protein FNV43_RR05403 [Rhamnella rubrinervis]